MDQKVLKVNFPLWSNYFSLEDDYEENSELNKEIDDLAFWLDETEALLTSFCDPTDRSKLNDLELRNKVRPQEAIKF